MWLKKEKDNRKLAEEKAFAKGREGEKEREPGRVLRWLYGFHGSQGKNRELLLITYLFVGLFLIAMGYFTYFQVIKSQDVINNPYNSRQNTFADRVVRGKILADGGEVLAETKVDEEKRETRYYPYGAMFAHVVGYSTNGKSGIEQIGNFNLLRSNTFFLERVIHEFQEEKNLGDNLVTTLNVKLQQTAYEALGSHKGAVVVLEPRTGKVLAMVSKPDFNPNEINSSWEELIAVDGEDSRLLNRATQGLYPPGSTFKILTTVAYIRQSSGYLDFRFSCAGKFEKDENVIRCYHNKAHGEENLEKAFAKSCNSAFASLGLDISAATMNKTAEDFLFQSELPISIVYNKSRFQLAETAEDWEKMQTAIGQGKTMITPMHLALITSAAANGGNLMNPYFIQCIENANGDVIKKYMPTSYGKLMSSAEAGILSELMEAAVKDGTAAKLQGLRESAAGKTGTAEYSSDKGKSHAWFTGFSPVNNPEIAVTVIVEEAGAGSEFAVPIAKKIFEAYYQQ